MASPEKPSKRPRGFKGDMSTKQMKGDIVVDKNKFKGKKIIWLDPDVIKKSMLKKKQKQAQSLQSTSATKASPTVRQPGESPWSKKCFPTPGILIDPCEDPSSADNLDDTIESTGENLDATIESTETQTIKVEEPDHETGRRVRVGSAKSRTDVVQCLITEESQTDDESSIPSKRKRKRKQRK